MFETTRPFRQVTANQNHIRGALLGTAAGDALGMPVEGISRAHVRTYYNGIKEYRDDEERRDLSAGQWTDDTQFTFALVRALTRADVPAEFPKRAAREYVELLPEARRWGPTSRSAVERLAGGASHEESGSAESATNGAAMRASPLGAWWSVRDVSHEEAWAALRPVFEVTHRHPASVAAGFGQAFAVRQALRRVPDALDQGAFWREVTQITAWAEEQLGDDRRVSERLRALSEHLSDTPLDLLDRCDGVGVAAGEAWPFAVAMFARNPGLNEATLLSAINVGGDTDTVGAMTGALLGALHGWSAFPDGWQTGLEDADRLLAEADTFYEAL
jgi:ADP-ribosylglycohydrolase